MEGFALRGKSPLSLSLSLVLLFTAVTACSRAKTFGLQERPTAAPSTSPEAPRGHVAFQPPFVPITIGFDGKSLKVDVEAKVVTPIGTVKLGSTAAEVTKDDGKPLPAEPADAAQLIVCLQGSGGQTCQATRINTGRKITVEMNGKFVQEVERNRIVIQADPGATITLRDSGPATKIDVRGPARPDIEEFEFHSTSPDTDVDLERSQAGIRADLRYDHISGELSMINGAKIAPYDTYSFSIPNEATDYPSEAECLAKEQEKWTEKLSEDELEANHVIVCTKTSEGDLGYLLLVPDREVKPVAYYVYSYVWVR